MAWRKGYCYEYNGVQWVELDPALPGNRDKYMVALADLLADAPDGAFNNLFCMNLIAQQAFVRYLQALEITLSELTENGQTKRGSIKSQNYRAGQAGFKIDYNGDVEFNGGRFRGDLGIDGLLTALRADITNLQAGEVTIGGRLDGAEGNINRITLRLDGNNGTTLRLEDGLGRLANFLANNGTFTGTLSGNIVDITGTHTAGQARRVAHDNIRIEVANRIPMYSNVYAAKQIRIAGTGSVRFKINYRGNFRLERLLQNGTLGLVASGGNVSSETEMWTGSVQLPDKVNIFVLRGFDYNNSTFINDTFEAWVAGTPGIFEHMSSPF